MKLLVKETIAVIALFLMWYLIAALMNNPVVPYPHTVFINYFKEDTGIFFGHFLASFLRILYTLIVAIATGVPLGILFGRIKVLDELTSPLIYLLYPVPKIVFLPIVIILLGLGELSKVFIISLIVFFQILVTVKDAAKSIGEEEVLSVKSMGGKPVHVLAHVIIPSVLPGIFTSMRIAIGTCVAVLFFAESFATEKGLGYLIIDAWSKFDYVLMYNGIILMGTLGFMLYVAINLLEKRLCRWTFE